MLTAKCFAPRTTRPKGTGSARGSVTDIDVGNRQLTNGSTCLASLAGYPSNVRPRELGAEAKRLMEEANLMRKLEALKKGKAK